MADDREYMLRVRMSLEERDMLARLAKADGLTASDFVRLKIRQSFSERFEEKKSKK